MFFVNNAIYGSFHQVGTRFVTVSIVTSLNVPSIILDYDSYINIVVIFLLTGGETQFLHLLI